MARQKLDTMISKIGYPDWVTDKGSIENYYRGVRLNWCIFYALRVEKLIRLLYYTKLAVSSFDHFGNLQNARSFIQAVSFKALRGITDSTRWNTFPTIAEVSYDQEQNSFSKNMKFCCI